MKPTSMIFIVVALIIILCGWLTCKNAEERALEEGIEIFNQTLDSDDNTVNTVLFGEGEIYNKLEFVIDEADVYIYGGTAEPYIELYNFDEGTYTLTTSNRNIAVNTMIDFMSVIKFWESGFSFNGLRNYVKRGISDEVLVSKKINVYLPTDGDLNVINININKGNVYMANFDTSIDVSVTLGEGNAVFTSVNTTSYIKTDITKGSLYLNDVSVDSLEAAMKAGDINAVNFSFNNVSVTGAATNVSITTPAVLEFYDMHLSARNGTVSISGEDYGDSYNFESSAVADATVLITVTEGNIIVNHEIPSLTDEDVGTEGDGAETGGSADAEASGEDAAG